MIHVNGIKGGIDHTYGGEIDVMPTLLDLLGIKNTDTIQLGNDLLAKDRNQTVAFRMVTLFHLHLLRSEVRSIMTKVKMLQIV